LTPLETAIGNLIKTKLTEKPKSIEDKPISKGTINFPSLAQSAIHNFAAAKIVGQRPPVRYVPVKYVQ
jgi:hypothetical protein